VGDNIDDLMAKALPGINKAVAGGLGVKPPLEDLIPVEQLSDAQPYRVTQTSWQEHPRRDVVVARLPKPTGFDLREFKGEVRGAVELVLSRRIEPDDLETNPDEVHTFARALAEDARFAERSTVLDLIAKGAGDGGAYDTQSVKDQVAELKGLSRLIGTGSPAKKGAEEGWIDSAVDPGGALPFGVSALLIRIGSGPVVGRVVDDLTLTWRRTANNKIELRLSERFFVDGITGAAVRFA
jgi:hypothetical protein